MIFQELNLSERKISRLQRSFAFLKSKKDTLANPFIIFLEQAFKHFAFSLSIATQEKQGTIYAMVMRNKTGSPRAQQPASVMEVRTCLAKPWLQDSYTVDLPSLRSPACLPLPILDFLVLLQTVSPLVGITGQCFFYQVKTQRHSLTLKMK